MISRFFQDRTKSARMRPLQVSETSPGEYQDMERTKIVEVLFAILAFALILLNRIGTTSASPDHVGTNSRVTAAVKRSNSTDTASIIVSDIFRIFQSKSNFDRPACSTFGFCHPNDEKTIAPLAPSRVLNAQVPPATSRAVLAKFPTLTWIHG